MKCCLPSLEEGARPRKAFEMKGVLMQLCFVDALETKVTVLAVEGFHPFMGTRF